MSIREGLSYCYELYGLRGVLAMSAYRLFGRPRELAAYPQGIRNPIYIRMMTADEPTYKHVLLEQEYAFELPFSPKTILDAGANIGTASIYFIHRYPDAKIIAVEAEDSNFAILRRNVRPYPTIVPVHAALWNRDGEISVAEPEGTLRGWAFVTREDSRGPKVRAVTMSTLMREMNVHAFDLAKIDIEGAEREVFEDTRWLSGLGALMIELHDRLRPGCCERVERAMQGFTRSQRGQTTFYVRRL